MKTSRQVQQQRIKDSTLEAKTMLYWQIGIARVGKGPLNGCSVEKAIGLLSDLEMATTDKSPLGQQVTEMLDAVIKRPKKRRPSKVDDRPLPKKIAVYNTDDDDDGPRAA